MRTAVTGTGGALVGSAATTVGGFGVLVFAILPPLQQFGMITGLTIVYALLGSVLVLPSLLVVWTRYVGPTWARRQVRDDADEPPASPRPAGLSPGSSADRGGSVPAARDAARSRAAGADARTGDGSSAPVANGGAGDTAAGATASAGEVTPVRAVGHGEVLPDGPVGVGVAVSGVGGRVLLREAVPGGSVRVTAVEPDPVALSVRGEAILVAWDVPPGSLVSVGYRARPPGEAVHADDVAFEGTVETADGTAPVGGVASVTVTGDPLASVRSRGAVTGDDLRSIEAHRAAGAVADADAERLYRAWLREEAVDGGDAGADYSDAAAVESDTAELDQDLRAEDPNGPETTSEGLEEEPDPTDRTDGSTEGGPEE
jgi:hypothetical protein